jgi:flagellar biosynthesis protein FlhF
MRLKRFRAPTMAEAMASVRAELGAEALILDTRRLAGGVEVTAAIEPENDPAAHLATLSDDGSRAGMPTVRAAGPMPLDLSALVRTRLPAATAADVTAKTRSSFARHAEAFRFHGLPTHMQTGLQDGSVSEGLRAMLRFGRLDLATGTAPLALVGPPGAGKTLTIAKLATRLVLAGTPPLVVTADGKRAGAPEQLAAFTRLLGLSLIVADSAVTIGRAIGRRVAGAPVLIDTPGLDPFDESHRSELAAVVSAAGATLALVLPAGLDPAESADLAEGFAAMGAGQMIATRLDHARRLGGVVTAAATASLMLTEAGIGSGAADGLTALTPEFLAARVVAIARPRNPPPGDPPSAVRLERRS